MTLADRHKLTAQLREIAEKELRVGKYASQSTSVSDNQQIHSPISSSSKLSLPSSL